MTPNDYMQRALALARRGEGHTAPNPMVGCVVVKDGRIIGESYHARCGEFHAERRALMQCTEDPAGADLYVTLEPCCHQGRTPPCTDIILEKRIRRVYIAALDVNPLVAGKGAQILRDAGVEVHTGLLEDEARKQNEVFFHFMQTQTPFVVMKYAMSLDGKTACAGGDSQWITGEESRAFVHRLRGRYSAILVGIGTVLADDPLLTCRMEGGTNPLRVVCDSHLSVPFDAQIVQTAKEVPTLVVCTAPALVSKDGMLYASLLQQMGVQIMAAGNGEQVDLGLMMKQLAAASVDSVLLEGGGTLNAAALRAGIVQKVYAFIGNKLIGGADAKSPVEGVGAASMAEAAELTDRDVMQFGKDVCIVGYLPERQADTCLPD